MYTLVQVVSKKKGHQILSSKFKLCVQRIAVLVDMFRSPLMQDYWIVACTEWRERERHKKSILPNPSLQPFLRAYLIIDSVKQALTDIMGQECDDTVLVLCAISSICNGNQPLSVAAVKTVTLQRLAPTQELLSDWKRKLRCFQVG